MKRFLLIALGTFFLGLPFGRPGPVARADTPFGIQRFNEKKEPPPFSLKTLDGTPISPDRFKGKPTLLIFWCSWCGSCKDELPVMDKFSIGKRDEINIFTIVADGERESKVRRFVEQKKLTLPVILDIKEKTARSYGVRMVPTTFLIDPNGLMLGMIVGERDWSLPEAWTAIKDIFGLR